MTARWMPECERGRNIDMWWPPRQCQKKFGAIFVLVAAGFAPALFPPPNMCASTKSGDCLCEARRASLTIQRPFLCMYVRGRSKQYDGDWAEHTW